MRYFERPQDAHTLGYRGSDMGYERAMRRRRRELVQLAALTALFVVAALAFLLDHHRSITTAILMMTATASYLLGCEIVTATDKENSKP
jgi:hypothetical protein